MCPELYIFGDFDLIRFDSNNLNLAFIGKSFNLNEDKTNLANLSHAFINFLDANNLLFTLLTQASGNTLDLLNTSKFFFI